MAKVRDLVLDAWSALSHKAPMRGDVQARFNGWNPASWMGEEHRRRLTAYIVLAAYDANVAREFLDTTNQDDRDSRREYGDAALVIETVQAALLGESQEIVVRGAEDYDAALDEPPAEGETRDPDAMAANTTARGLAERQAFLRTWAEDVHLPLRMTDCERNTVRGGDGVYLLAWDDHKQRPVPAVMDAGFYFPVLPDTLDGYDYPDRVHFAWELPGEDFGDGKTRIRRITYDLTYLAPVLDEDALMSATTPEEADAAYELPADTSWQEVDGYRRVVRTYPWATEPSDRVCTVTDATWVLDDLKDAANVDAFNLDNATIRFTDDGDPVRDLDLGIDFLPVVHIPNTPPGGDHYGQSSLAKVLQVVDDLQAADTDAQAASSTTGSPIIGISGEATMGDNVLTGQRGKRIEVAPGLVLRLGANGRMDALDTSAQLAELRNYVKDLRDRLATNSRLPAALLGTVKPSEVPSGFAMQLSFGPLSSMVGQMRLVRSVKYPLMMKMVQRLYQANGALPPGPTPATEIQLGAFLPTDMAAVLEQVSTAYAAKLISLETAVTMLLEVGFPIDDVAEEIDRIQSRDFDGANDLADATNDQDAVREYLGMDPVAESQPAPVPVVPVVP